MLPSTGLLAFQLSNLTYSSVKTLVALFSLVGDACFPAVVDVCFPAVVVVCSPAVSEYYPNCEVVFMGMANIHSIRKSFQSLRFLCTQMPDPAK